MQRVSSVTLLLLCWAPGALLGQEGASVQVDGLTIRTVTSGLEGRDAVVPVVVFEAGAGSRIETWASILDEVAQFAPLVAYDRAGIGGSHWDSLPPTPERVASQLRRVLSELGAHPPYVLVGHSWGAALVNQFADTYSAEVRGMVFVDPTDFTWGPEEEIAVLAAVGMDSTYYEVRRDQRNDGVADLPPFAQAERRVVYDIADAWGPSHMGLNRADASVSVVIASQRPIPATTTVPFDAEAYLNAKHRARVQRLGQWVRGGGSFVQASTTEHYVHRVEPELVLTLIRETVAEGN